MKTLLVKSGYRAKYARPLVDNVRETGHSEWLLTNCFS